MPWKRAPTALPLAPTSGQRGINTMKKNGLAALGRLMMLCGLTLASPACATIVNGTTQDLYIDSEPGRVLQSRSPGAAAGAEPIRQPWCATRTASWQPRA